MSELARQIELFLDNLKREGASEHTVLAYSSDLAQFLERTCRRPTSRRRSRGLSTNW